MSKEQQVANLILALQHSPGFSLHEINDMLAKHSPKGVASVSDVNDYLSIGDKSLHSVSNDAWSFGKQIIEQSNAAGIKTIPITSTNYPRFLKLTPNPPPLLHLRGNQHVFDNSNLVSVVGTRKASHIGLTIAERIAGFLAGNGWTIVSGLALGIDAAAHKGCINKNGATIAVLAHGLHKAFPKTNESLGYEILERGGAWISEHPIGTEPKRDFFVQRNRLQVGVSVGSILIECDEQSGTVSQARYGIGQKREIFAILPDMQNTSMNLNTSGAKSLINHDNVIRIASKEQYPYLLDILSAKLIELDKKAKRHNHPSVIADYQDGIV
jgi:DNA processing protein